MEKVCPIFPDECQERGFVNTYYMIKELVMVGSGAWLKCKPSKYKALSSNPSTVKKKN
jgi:hypothetical protein